MRLVLLGAPGSGKSTQSVVLAHHFGVAHVPSGALLRHEVAATTPLVGGLSATSRAERSSA